MINRFYVIKTFSVPYAIYLILIVASAQKLHKITKKNCASSHFELHPKS